MTSGRHLRHRNVDFGKQLAVVLDDSLGSVAPPPVATGATLVSSQSKSTSGGRSSRSPSPATPRKHSRSPTPTADAEENGNAEPATPPAKNASFIPTPEVRTLTPIGIDILKKRPFKRPRHYIHIHLSTGSGLLDKTVRYDLALEDMEWCDERNLSPGIAETDKLTYDQIESLIDLFEKKAGAKTQKYDCQSVFGLAEAGRLAASSLCLQGRAVEDAYQYWISKRRRLGKSLLRIFQEAAPHDDPSPHVAFRMRESLRRVSTRHPRKNDSTAFSQIRRIRRDLSQLLTIVEAVRKRESIKRHKLLLSVEIFDAKLANSSWGTNWAAIAAAPNRTAESQEACKLLKSALPRSRYEKDILRTRRRQKQQQQRQRRPPPKRPRVRAPSDPAALPCLHTNLFEMKFSDTLSVSSADSDSSEGETDVDLLFHRQLERYLDDSRRKKPRKVRSVDQFPEHVGQLLFRYARDNRLVLDRIIFEKSGFSAVSTSGKRGTSAASAAVAEKPDADSVAPS